MTACLKKPLLIKEIDDVYSRENFRRLKEWIDCFEKDAAGVFEGDHGDLKGLLDDDHPQYLNTDRGDARYYTETEIDNFFEMLKSPDLPAGYIASNYFGTASSVPSGVETTVLNKTITTTHFLLQGIDVGGNNKAIYNIYIDGNLVAKKYTYYTKLHTFFSFSSLKIISGQAVTIKVLHNRPTTGDFQARILGIEKT